MEVCELSVSVRSYAGEVHSRGVPVTLRRLPDELIEGRFQHCGCLFHQLPLRRCRHGYPDLSFHPLEPRDSTPVPYLSCAIIAVAVASYLSDAIWLFRREHLPAGVAAQSFHLEHSRFHRRLSRHPRQRFRLSLRVYSAAVALRECVADGKIRMTDDELPRSLISARAVSAVSFSHPALAIIVGRAGARGKFRLCHYG